VVSAALVALGYPRADPIVGLAITLVILKITWDSWRVVSTTNPGEMTIEAVPPQHDPRRELGGAPANAREH